MSEKEKNQRTFDSIRRTDEGGMDWLPEVEKPMSEFWYARELMEVLQYAKWDNFHRVIKQAMISCKISQQEVGWHFIEVWKQSDVPVVKKSLLPDAGKLKEEHALSAVMQPIRLGAELTNRGRKGTGASCAAISTRIIRKAGKSPTKLRRRHYALIIRALAAEVSVRFLG